MNEMPIGYRLRPEMLAHVEDIARRVPEGERDSFFKDVADILRPIRELAQTDVRHACAVALTRRKTTTNNITEIRKPTI